MQLVSGARNRWKEYAGTSNTATYLWPRWLLLRAVGLVYVIIFSGIIDEGRALIGPNGISPVAEFCATLRGLFPNLIERFLRAPSVFWLSASPQMITALEYGGLIAAIALVLNLWPRATLFACWAIFLSFVSTWQVFSSSIDDQLLLETALVCIAFAPRGFRPGLGTHSPPRPIALFMMRWLLFRAMFCSGVIKLISEDAHWRNFTPMEVMYETSPLPTILGYLDHQLPHAYHLFEIALTFTAELIAPFLAIFGGRRGRWFAFIVWAIFQAGIQLTSSFGWLNTASIGLGLVLLDDQMLAALAEKLKLSRWADAIKRGAASIVLPEISAWSRYGLRFLLGLHFCLTVYFSITFLMKKPGPTIPAIGSNPVEFLFRDFKSANMYAPYGSFPLAKHEVEFEGTNDGGKTWRPYPFKYKPQEPDRICRFVAPWFGRFEATLQLAVNLPNSTVIPHTAERLLAQRTEVIALFKSNPFPERAPTAIRMPVYRFEFTSLETKRKTGEYWRKTYLGDYGPMVFIEKPGEIRQKPYSFYDETDLAFEVYATASAKEARAALVDLTTRAEANAAAAQEDQRREFTMVMAAAYLRLASVDRSTGDEAGFHAALADSVRYSDHLPRFTGNPDYFRDKEKFLLESVLGPMENAEPPQWKSQVPSK